MVALVARGQDLPLRCPIKEPPSGNLGKGCGSKNFGRDHYPFFVWILDTLIFLYGRVFILVFLGASLLWKKIVGPKWFARTLA